MDTQTVLLVIVATVLAMGLVLFQYHYRSKKRGTLGLLLSILRFLTWFGAFLLLINPKFSRNEYSTEKANLLVLTDNSSSMSKYRSEVENALSKLTSSDRLQTKFEMRSYGFGASLNTSDSFSFAEKSTNIAKALTTLNDVHSNENTAVIMLTDGNQTFGEDYVFGTANSKHSIYPVAIGDTTRYEDLRIDQVNVNKYAFLKNKYPVEIFVSYEGSGTISKMLTLTLDGKKVFNENVELSGTDNSKTVNALLEAGSVGVKYLQVGLSPLDGERNVRNNQKNLTVEVIDEKTKVAIISDIMHPDIGALKKAIESNEQRSVSIKKPSADDFDGIDLFILYQPNTSFKSVFEHIQQKNANSFIVIGINTDLNYLNNVRKQVRVEDGYPLQEAVPVRNDAFSKFDISETVLEGYPPLETDIGPVAISGDHEVLLKMRIKGAIMSSPMMSIMMEEEIKTVLLFGENIWKWRAHAYRNDQNFKIFDDFIGKLIVYLSNDKSKERLTLDFKSVYEGSNEAVVRASYFDEAFVFDSNANLELQLKNADTDVSRVMPMLLKNGFFEADLSDQAAGRYRFTVTVKNENQSRPGSFRILDFDVEQQFLSTDHRKLQQLADRNGGNLFYRTEVEPLVERLSDDERFVPLQSSKEKVVSLIDFRILLGIIATTLGLEWFIRKYNGLN
ncbi:MAG: vWA domain-containing protein [Aurantibacter sp.]